MDNMRLKILQAGEPVLPCPGTPANGARDSFPTKYSDWIQDMRETMRDAPGVGLAAPQVGVTLQLA